MLRYRFYPLDETGKISGPYSAADCEDDDAAVKWADELASEQGRGIEVWQGARLVYWRVGSTRSEAGAGVRA